MPDIFDSLPAASPQTGDIFDHVESLAPQSGTGNFLNAAGKSATQGFWNLASRLGHNFGAALEGGTEGTEQANGQVVDPTQQQHAAALQQDIRQHASTLEQALPSDPGRISGRLGNIAGGVAPMMAASAVGGPGLGAATMIGQGAEGRIEATEQNPNLTGLQKAGYIGGGAALDLGLALLPGASAGGGLLSRLTVPALKGAAEGAAYSGAENLLAQQTGVDPNRPLTEGMGESALTFAGLHAGHQAISEVTNALPKRAPAPKGDIFDHVAPTEPGFAAGIGEETPAKPKPQEASPRSPQGGISWEALTGALKDEGHQVPAPQVEAPPAPAPAAEGGNTLKQMRDLQTWAKEHGQQVPQLTPELHQGDEPVQTYKGEERRGLATQSQEPWAGEERRSPTAKAAEGSDVFKQAAASKAPEPHQPLRDLAASYNEKAGLEPHYDNSYAPVNEDRAKQIASAYDAMKHDPNDPQVKASYDALKRETLAQYQHLKDAGYKFTPSETGYASSADMLKDLRDNQHLRVFTGGDMPADHPLAEAAPANEDGLKTYNEIFRAVHDAFGHGKEGVGFGPRGEENAWRQHSQMYSDAARRAMTAETRGQNSWVNFGPHGEANRANPKDTKYAEQKAGIFPDEAGFHNVEQGEGESLFGRLVNDESGAQQLHMKALTGPGSIYHEEIKPRMEKVAEFLGKGVEAIRSVFPVETLSASSDAANAFRARLAQGRNVIQRAGERFQEAHEAFGKMPEIDQLEFQRRMYNKVDQQTPELQKIADAMYEAKNAARKQLVALGHDVAADWDEKKWNMLWKKAPGRLADVISKISRPGKVEGSGNFLKAKTLSDFDEGLSKGLVPKHANPVDQFMATTAEQTRYIAGVKAMKDLADVKAIIRLKPGEAVPDGWSEVPAAAKGPLNGILRDVDTRPTTPPSPKGPLAGVGKLVAPDNVNRILQNQTQPSLFAKGFAGDVFRALQSYNNLATQTLLGLSGFHVTKVAKESLLLQNARAFDLLAKGEPGKAAGASAKAGTDLIDNIERGKKIQDQLLGKASASPEEARRNAAMIEGGFSAKSDDFYETSFRKKFWKALDDGGVQGLVRAATYTLPAASEGLTSHGVFKYVQHAKLAIGSDLVSDYLRQNPNATRDEIRQNAGRISDHMDNILGMMERDNLFWNRTARDLATLSTLSVGWNYGSIRAAAGGAIDLGRGALKLGQGGKLADIDTRRISYLASMATATAISGAIATYLATGKGPQELKDYVFPKSGTKDREGHDVRYNTGLYTSDYYDFLTHPFNTTAAKASPLIHAVTDITSNRDYRNDPIYDAHDPSDKMHYKMAYDIAHYLGKTNLPMSIQQAMQTIQGGGTSGKSTTERLLPWMGVKHAPVAISESPAELAARDIVSGAPHTSSDTPEHRQAMSTLTNALKDKDPEAEKQIQDAVAAGTITPKDAQAAHKRSTQPGGLKGLLDHSGLDARTLMAKVWPEMSDQEIRDNQFVIRRKIAGANVPPEEKRDYFDKLNTAIAGGK